MQSPRSQSEAVRVDLSAFELLRQSQALLEGHYLFFVLVAGVGTFVGGLVPLGVLMGPILCGIYLALRVKARGESPETRQLSEGFDHFLPGFLTVLLVKVLCFAALLPLVVTGIVPIVLLSARGMDSPLEGVAFGLSIGTYYLAIFAVVAAVYGAAMFAIPLVVDRGLNPLDAVMQSARAVWLNAADLVWVIVLNAILLLAGSLVCCVGFYLVLPLTFGSVYLAYVQVLPGGEAEPPPTLEAPR